MKIDSKIITMLTKKLAQMKLKKYKSLSEIKDDFDTFAGELIDLDSDKDSIESLKVAADYFNLLEEEDFKTNDSQRLNESKAVISKFTKEFNTVLVKWRKDLGQL